MIWLDVARVVSIMAVVVLHVAGSVVALAALGSADWWYGNLYDSLVRWCVPVFVMVSGALLLDPAKAEGILVFYRKRAARVLVPLVFWSAAYILWNHRGALSGIRGVDVLQSVARGWPHYHLWFLYMILCLYLFVPFLRTLVLHSRRRDLWVLVGLLFLFAAVNELVRVFSDGGAGLFINWFLPYLAYFLCGHLLSTSERRVPMPWLLAVFGAAVLATALGCYWLGSMQGLERGMYFYGYLSLSVIPMSISVMLMFKALTLADGPARKARRISQLTLGVYLVHPMLLETLRAHVLKPEDYAPLVTVPLVAALVALGALAVAWVFGRVPFLNRTI